MGVARLWVSGGLGSAVYGVAVLFAEAAMPTAAAVAEGIAAAIVTAGLILIPTALVLFPDGALVSARWRPLAWVLAAAAILGAFTSVVNGGSEGCGRKLVWSRSVSRCVWRCRR